MSALQILHYMKKEEKKPEIEIVADMSPVSLETTDLSYGMTASQHRYSVV